MEIKIERITETTGFDRAGNVVKMVHIDYSIGEHGIFSIEIPKAEFQSAKAIDIVKKDAKGYKDLLESKLEV